MDAKPINQVVLDGSPIHDWAPVVSGKVGGYSNTLVYSLDGESSSYVDIYIPPEISAESVERLMSECGKGSNIRIIGKLNAFNGGTEIIITSIIKMGNKDD